MGLTQARPNNYINRKAKSHRFDQERITHAQGGGEEEERVTPVNSNRAKFPDRTKNRPYERVCA